MIIIILMMPTASLGKTSRMCYHRTSLPPYPMTPMPSLASLIESPMDKSINTINTNTNASQRTTPTRRIQSAYQGFRPKPIHLWNGEIYQKATSQAHTLLIHQIRHKFNEEISAQYTDTRLDNDDKSMDILIQPSITNMICSFFFRTPIIPYP